MCILPSLLPSRNKPHYYINPDIITCDTISSANLHSYLSTSGTWSLFCPNEAKGLPDVWGAEFEALYEKYEAEGKARRVMPAQ